MRHVSFSSLSSWLYCGKQYELEKIKKVPQVPAWFLLGGSAFHSATEDIDKHGTGDHAYETFWDLHFGREIERAENESGLPRSEFRAAGKTKANPRGQDEAAWNQLGPEMLVLYERWAHEGRTIRMIEEPLEEVLDFSVLPFRGYIDRVYDDLIVDIKTGSSQPRNALQLGVYRAGLLLKYGEAPDYGAFYKARDGKLSKQFPLHKYTPEYVGKLFDSHRRAVEAKVFIPNESFSCNSCSVRQACYTAGGSLSAKYDTLDPRYTEEGSDSAE
jgi:CRISPR/Cas system-associated exonuclease Cas4 (RecB family)